MELNEKITPAELRQSFQTLSERLDVIEADTDKMAVQLQSIVDALASALAATAPAAAAVPTGQTVQFDANVILVGIDDNGQYTYKAKGGQYQKFGVRIWPEVLPALGLDPDQLKPGPNAVNLHLVALMGDKGPRKVIGIVR